MILPEFPNIDFVILPDSIPFEMIETFLVMYRTHSQCLLDSTLIGAFADMENYLIHFWRGIPQHLFYLMEYDVVADVICVCDSIVYQTLVDVLIPATMQEMSENLLRDIRVLASGWEQWLRTALAAAIVSKTFSEKKISAGRRFASSLKRQASFLHLTQTSRPILYDAQLVNQMTNDIDLIDLNAVDYYGFHSTTTFEDNNDDDGDCQLAVAVVKEFRELLRKQATVEAFVEWLDLSVEQKIIKPTKQDGRSFETRAQDFVLRWSYLIGRISHSLTINNAKSFASIHLIHLLLTEYMLLAIESQLHAEKDRELQRTFHRHCTPQSPRRRPQEPLYAIPSAIDSSNDANHHFNARLTSSSSRSKTTSDYISYNHNAYHHYCYRAAGHYRHYRNRLRYQYDESSDDVKKAISDQSMHHRSLGFESECHLNQSNRQNASSFKPMSASNDVLTPPLSPVVFGQGVQRPPPPPLPSVTTAANAAVSAPSSAASRVYCCPRGNSDGDHQFSWAVYSRHSSRLMGGGGGASFRNSSSTISPEFLSANQMPSFGRHHHYHCGASASSSSVSGGCHGVATFARRAFVEDRCDGNDPPQHHLAHSQLHANTNLAADYSRCYGGAPSTDDIWCSEEKRGFTVHDHYSCSASSSAAAAAGEFDAQPQNNRGPLYLPPNRSMVASSNDAIRPTTAANKPRKYLQAEEEMSDEQATRHWIDSRISGDQDF